MNKYKTFIFDCDGVILNSNRIKTEAFYKTVLPYGEEYAQKFKEHHIANGGISRYKKFEYFLTNMVPCEKKGFGLNKLLKTYAAIIEQDLLNCEIAPKLKELRDLTINSRWIIVSGGDQMELQEIMHKRNLSNFFDAGIFGSPDSKEVILKREIENENIQLPALFLGDTKYDYESAKNTGLDFIFLSGWSEFKELKEYANKNKIKVFENIAEFITYGK